FLADRSDQPHGARLRLLLARGRSRAVRNAGAPAARGQRQEWHGRPGERGAPARPLDRAGEGQPTRPGGPAGRDGRAAHTAGLRHPGYADAAELVGGRRRVHRSAVRARPLAWSQRSGGLPSRRGFRSLSDTVRRIAGCGCGSRRMIEARDFVEAARERGFDWYAGVPCSFLTPFINYVLQDSSLHYVSMANEGDAVALIAGVALSGSRGISMMQNSGLGNAVSPLTSLTWTFRLPQLLIVTWRGQPGVADEPQHALMGPITPTVLETMQIPWELFPTEPSAVGPALDRAIAHMEATGRPYALLMQKGSVVSYPLKAPPNEAPRHLSEPVLEPRRRPFKARASRTEALREVIAHTSIDSSVLLASTGFCGRELYAIDDRPNQLYMVGSMGCVVPLALGVALGRPDLRVIALDGDGAALMRMGAFATVGAYGPANLQHLLLDNGAHDSTGGQATVSPNVSFAEVAAACGYASALDTDRLERIGEWLEMPPANGARFARLLTRPGSPANLPRPTIAPVDVKRRLMQHFGSSIGAF